MTGSDRPRDPRGRTSRLTRAVPLVAVILSSAVALSGCSGSSSAPVAEPQTSTTPASLATSPPTEQDQVLAAYRAFWAHLAPVSRVSANARRPILEKYAVDPELSSLLRGMATADAKGQVFYGENIPRPKLIRLSIPKGIAVVDDCQDSSQAGIEDTKTNKHLTVGVSRNHVVVTMHQSAQGWRVAFVSYSRTKC